MTRILFVCSGNEYRSPIAERLFAAHARGVLVGSAGTVARSGVAMSPRTAHVISSLGGATEGFATRRLTAELVGSADLVLGLAREHREAAVRLCPAALRRCFVLEEFVRLAEGADSAAEVVARAAAARGRWPVASADDVEDPAGQPDEVLRWCAERIDRAVRRAAALLSVAG